MNGLAEGVRVSNQELATVREAMREMHRLLAALDRGELEKRPVATPGGALT